MKAWRIEHHGGPEALVLKEIEQPKPGPMEALVKVAAVGLNHLDIWVKRGVEGHKFHLPITPGCDISGTIAEFGPLSETAKPSLQTDGLQIGAPVIINPGISCGRCEICLTGFDVLCKNAGIIGETRDGGCAEYVVVPIANLILRPSEIPAVAGAALSVPYLTAWTMLTRKAQLKAGETILIHAGGSGVSVGAIQMAKLLGATVITTVGFPEKIKKAQELGADYVINYKKTSFRDEVKKILATLPGQPKKKGCEVVIDHVGSDTFQDSLKCLTWGGRIVTCGATSGSEVKIDLKAVFFKNLSILGSTMGSKGDFIRLVQLVAEGKLKAVVDTVYSMDQLPEAMTKIENRNVFGKVILTGF